MNQELCLIQANCQADALINLLQSRSDFTCRYRLRAYTNFLKEPVPEKELAECSIFIYQHLGAKWGELASAVLLKNLNPKAKQIKIPNMLFKGYWPFWTNHSPSEFGDFFLDKLIAMGLNKGEILHVYLSMKLAEKFDLQKMFQESIEIERTKEVGCIVNTVDFVLEHYRRDWLFCTINHPRRILLALVAKAIFQELELTWNEAEMLALPSPYPEFDLPIHPQVAKFHNLRFISENTVYNVFGKKKSFQEYVSNYIDSQLMNLRPLSAYLHLV